MNNKKYNNKSSITSSIYSIIHAFFILMAFALVKVTVEEYFSNKKTNLIKSSYKNLEKELDNQTFNNNLIEEHKVNNEELSLVSIPLGFFQTSDVILHYCENSGYIPMKFIRKVNSYKKDYNLKNDFVNYYKKLGLTQEQAELIYSENINLFQKYSLNSLKNEYLELKKNKTSITVKKQCQLYDEFSDDIIKEKIEDIKKKSPRTYEKFFMYNRYLEE